MRTTTSKQIGELPPPPAGQDVDLQVGNAAAKMTNPAAKDHGNANEPTEKMKKMVAVNDINAKFGIKEEKAEPASAGELVKMLFAGLMEFARVFGMAGMYLGVSLVV